jgi:transcriptional regulator with XRE-family HTH domain
MNLGDRVRAARKHGKLTQVQLAERVGISQQTLSALERGESEGSVKLTEIAVECGVSPEWLARGVGEMCAPALKPERASQNARLDPAIIASTMRALLIVLRRRDPKIAVDLTDPKDAFLFAEAYGLAEAMVDDDLTRGAAIADLVAEREARGGQSSKSAGGVNRGKAGATAAGGR